MGLADLVLDEPKVKVEKTQYEKGKRFCCYSVCQEIDDGINNLVDEIDEVQYERFLEEHTLGEEQEIIHDNKVAIKTLRNLQRAITKREPHCKC